MKVGANRPRLVVFGVTGDLARTKILPAVFELARAGRPCGRIVGVGRSDWSTADLRRAAVEAVSVEAVSAVNDARHDLLRSVLPLRPDDVVLGQCDGYLDTQAVDPLSTTETYVRATVRIDNDRWRNVLFTLISGKALADNRVSVSISFRAQRAEPLCGASAERNQLVIELAPKQSVTLHMQGLPLVCPVDEARAELSAALDSASHNETAAYSGVFEDASRGDRRWFSRIDVVAESWRVVQDILHHDPPAVYASGRRDIGLSNAGRRIVKSSALHRFRGSSVLAESVRRPERRSR